MEGKIINFEENKNKLEINSFLDLFKVAKLIEILSIENDGTVNYRDFGIARTGFVFGLDFVTFEPNPKVFPINLALNDEFFSYDDEPGIYVAELVDVKKGDFVYDSLVNDLELARKVESWYFDNFLSNEDAEYFNDGNLLVAEDNTFFGEADINEPIDFNKYKKKNK